jgi:hypothetical protein
VIALCVFNLERLEKLYPESLAQKVEALRETNLEIFRSYQLLPQSESRPEDRGEES